MPDIGLVWDGVNCRGDWCSSTQTPAGADDGMSGDLAAAVLVSLFTDRRGADDYVPRDGTQNRRGWWGDAYAEQPIGSRLWQLEPSKRTNAVLLAARDMCSEALAWLLEDGIVSTIDIATFWAGRVALGITITITQTLGPGVLIEAALPWGLS